MTRIKKTREYFAEKFKTLMQNTYNYVPQEGEIFRQCDGIEEPSYWFISNYARLFTVYGTKQPLKQIKVYYAKTGPNRQQHDWHYATEHDGKVREPRLHRLVAKYFLENEFEGFAEVEGDVLEVHHKKPESTFTKDQPFEANNFNNLQILPSKIHDEVTMLSNYGLEKKLKGLGKDVPRISLTDELQEKLMRSIEQHSAQGNLVYMVDVNNGLSEAHPLSKKK